MKDKIVDTEKLLVEKEEHENEMAQFVGKGFTPTPIEKIEIKPYDFRVEDEID